MMAPPKIPSHMMDRPRNPFEHDWPQHPPIRSSASHGCTTIPPVATGSGRTACLRIGVGVPGDGPSDHPFQAGCLAACLEQLLDNAVKYRARARVSLENTPQTIRLFIDDDGPGIPDSEVEAAFQPFRRLTPRPAQIVGTGLGLSIARSIVRGLGGDIALANRPSAGLRVTVRLPAVSRASNPRSK